MNYFLPTFQALDIPEHLRAPLKHVRRACIQQSNVDEKHILATRDGFIPDVPELKCYILCLFEHGGIINDDDSIDFTIVYHLMTPDHRKTIEYVSETCGTKRMSYSILNFAFSTHISIFFLFFIGKFLGGSTRCETAWLTLKCFYELAPEVVSTIDKLKNIICTLYQLNETIL